MIYRISSRSITNTRAFQSFRKSTKITIKKRIRFILFWQIRPRILPFHKRFSLQKKKQDSKKFFFIKNQHRLSSRGRNLQTHFFFQSFYGRLSNQYVRNLYKTKGGVGKMRVFRFLTRIKTQLAAIVFRLFFVKTIYQAYELIRKRNISVNGDICRYPKRIIAPGDIITFSKDATISVLSYTRNYYQFLERSNNLSLLVKNKNRNQFLKTTKKGKFEIIKKQVNFSNNENSFAIQTVFLFLQKEIFILCGKSIKHFTSYTNQVLRIILTLEKFKFFFFFQIQKFSNILNNKQGINSFDIIILIYILHFFFQERLLKELIIDSTEKFSKDTERNGINLWKKETGFLFSLLDIYCSKNILSSIKKRRKFKSEIGQPFASLIFYSLIDKQEKKHRKSFNLTLLEKKQSRVFLKELGFSFRKTSNNLKKGDNSFSFLYRLPPINMHVDYTISTIFMLYSPQIILVPKPLIIESITKAYK